MLTVNPEVLDAMHFDAQSTEVRGMLKCVNETPCDQQCPAGSAHPRVSEAERNEQNGWQSGELDSDSEESQPGAASIVKHSDSGCAYRSETPQDFNEHEGNEEHRTKATVAVQRSLPAGNVLCPGSDDGLKACTNEDVFAIAKEFSKIASDFKRAVNFEMPKYHLNFVQDYEDFLHAHCRINDVDYKSLPRILCYPMELADLFTDKRDDGYGKMLRHLKTSESETELRETITLLNIEIAALKAAATAVPAPQVNTAVVPEPQFIPESVPTPLIVTTVVSERQCVAARVPVPQVIPESVPEPQVVTQANKFAAHLELLSPSLREILIGFYASTDACPFASLIVPGEKKPSLKAGLAAEVSIAECAMANKRRKIAQAAKTADAVDDLFKACDFGGIADIEQVLALAVIHSTYDNLKKPNGSIDKEKQRAFREKLDSRAKHRGSGIQNWDHVKQHARVVDMLISKLGPSIMIYVSKDIKRFRCNVNKGGFRAGNESVPFLSRNKEFYESFIQDCARQAH
ncbi:hypothetical protein HDU87_002493 [Geranomyces variabilis]|uniref:Uncharacterized protein n=1 Tax=Geranomyces variabilis TaxID=109894 RepID=A0AAD5TB92_9FUNG|nr:hypothetical protein HDU87_002493 [Geranomyces variabilis]